MCEETKLKNLKKCLVPWCRGEGRVMESVFYREQPYSVRCLGCGLTTPPCERIKEAVAIWNREPLGDKVVRDGDTWSEDTAKEIIDKQKKPEIIKGRIEDVKHLPDGKMDFTLVAADGSSKYRIFGAEIKEPDFTKEPLDLMGVPEDGSVEVKEMPLYSWGEKKEEIRCRKCEGSGIQEIRGDRKTWCSICNGTGKETI